MSRGGFLKFFDDFGDRAPVELPKYVVAFDILTIISCIAVVALHVNSAFWRFSYDRYWITSNLIETLCYFAVPVFVMLSGATLINYRERYSTREFFKRRVAKTFVPFIVWSGIAIVYNILKDGMQIFGGTFSLKKLFEIVFLTRANGTYWFFIVLFALYLSVPLLSAVEKSKRKRVFTYTALVAIFGYSILPLALGLLKIQMNNSIQLPVAAGYVMFLLVGYLIAHYHISKTTRIVIYAFGALGFALHFFGTHFLSYRAGAIDGTFKDYLNIPSVMFSIAVFVFVYYNKHLPKSPRTIRFVKMLSGTAFGVYLVHQFVIEIVLHISGFEITTWWWRVFGTMAIYTVCVLAIMVIKKIPIIKNIVP